MTSTIIILYIVSHYSPSFRACNLCRLSNLLLNSRVLLTLLSLFKLSLQQLRVFVISRWHMPSWVNERIWPFSRSDINGPRGILKKLANALPFYEVFWWVCLLMVSSLRKVFTFTVESFHTPAQTLIWTLFEFSGRIVVSGVALSLYSRVLCCAVCFVSSRLKGFQENIGFFHWAYLRAFAARARVVNPGRILTGRSGRTVVSCTVLYHLYSI